ncbi:HMA2 domain-containing protein [Neosynechococcus sphagnicola]|uniref:P-type ATPase n=1 Tax=Neosynechococcus sphagnicola TaxID=1501145 RepID=UPI00068F9FBC|nr:hypothetical protein [Neosynechococcus sphagnicola]
MTVTVEVAHAAAGRLRVRIPQLADDRDFTHQLADWVSALDGVEEMRINGMARSLIIEYSPAVLTESALLDQISGYIQQADRVPLDSEPLPSETQLLDRPVISDWEHLPLPFLSLGLALVTAPLELPPLLFGVALVGAALPWLTRAADSIVQDGRPNVDLLDSLWMFLHALRGEFVAPALKTTLVGLRRTFRGTTSDERAAQAQAPLDFAPDLTWMELGRLQQRIPLTAMEVGDRLVVATNQLIPVDGIILTGAATIDAAEMTRETLPSHCTVGQAVYAGSRVVAGEVEILVQRLGDQTRAAWIAHLIKTLPVYSTDVGTQQAMLSHWAVVPTILGSATLFAFTGALGPAISPLQLDFGSGVQISMPTAILSALVYAARSGIYIRSGRALEALAHSSAVVIYHPTDAFTQRQDFREAIAHLEAQGMIVQDLNHLPPSEIAAVVHDLHRQGKTIAWIGDAIPEFASHAHADVSVAMARPGDLNLESADVLLLEEDWHHLILAIAIAKQALAVVYQNTAAIVIPNLVVVLGGVFLGFPPIIAVCTNNCTALMAELNGLAAFANWQPPLVQPALSLPPDIPTPAVANPTVDHETPFPFLNSLYSWQLT